MPEQVENDKHASALQNFEKSIDNDFKNYFHDTIAALMEGLETSDLFSKEQKVNAITELTIMTIKWRIKYEYLLTYLPSNMN